MLSEPLPTTLDVRKAAAREATAKGVLALAELTRLAGFLASNEGRVEAVCAFSRDEQNRSLVSIEIDAQLQVSCQRCLEPMPIVVRSGNRLAIVADDEQAKQLPATLEPWLLATEQGDLWLLVEDELILSLPIVSYHETEECRELLEGYQQPDLEEDAAEDNPFKVLERLKPGSK